MPKIRQKYDDYAKESLLREIRKCQGTADLMNGKLLSDASGIPYQTLMRRLKTPGDFTLDEVRKLNNAIHLDPFILLSFLGYSKKEIKQLQE